MTPSNHYSYAHTETGEPFDEYARLQTFPDDWVFYGNNKRELQLQIGNAVPVIFAEKIALKVREALEFLDGRKQEVLFEVGEQIKLF